MKHDFFIVIDFINKIITTVFSKKIHIFKIFNNYIKKINGNIFIERNFLFIIIK